MRVMVLMNSLNTGGAEFSTLSLYQWMAKRGVTVHIVCLKETSPSLNPADFGFSDQVEYVTGKSFLQKVKRLRQIIKRVNPDLIHSVLFDANLLGRVSKMLGGNFIHLESLVNEMYSEHRLNDPHVNRFKLNGYRLLDKVTKRFGVDHFHATSHSVSLHYQTKLGIKAGRITVVERGRDENVYVGNQESRRQVRVALNIDEDEMVLIMIARQEFQKGYDVLLKALSKLSGSIKWTCVGVGRQGNATREIDELSRQLNLESKIKWLGHRTDVMPLLAMADIFVFPTRFEGLPGVLIEAEAARLPIVCSDIPNNKEVVTEGENAVVFPVNDTDTFARGIRMLMNSPTLREEFGAASLTIFKKRFNWEQSHQRMEQLINQLVKK